MLIVGERLNSSRTSIFEAFDKKEERFLLDESRMQEQAGATYLDLNAAALQAKEIDVLRWIIPLVQNALNIHFSIDTPNPDALEAALKIHRGAALLNSFTGEAEKSKKLLPLISDFKPRVIYLCLDEAGPPRTIEAVLRMAEAGVDILLQAGLAPEDIFIDPGVYPLAVEPQSPSLFLGALEKIERRLGGVKTIAGLSNLSFGLPERRLLNRTFLVMAMERGLDAVICDPLDGELQSAMAAATAVLGRDPSLQNFLAFIRKKKKGDGSIFHIKQRVSREAEKGKK